MWTNRLSVLLVASWLLAACTDVGEDYRWLKPVADFDAFEDVYVRNETTFCFWKQNPTKGGYYYENSEVSPEIVRALSRDETMQIVLEMNLCQSFFGIRNEEEGIVRYRLGRSEMDFFAFPRTDEAFVSALYQLHDRFTHPVGEFCRTADGTIFSYETDASGPWKSSPREFLMTHLSALGVSEPEKLEASTRAEMEDCARTNAPDEQ